MSFCETGQYISQVALEIKHSNLYSSPYYLAKDIHIEAECLQTFNNN